MRRLSGQLGCANLAPMSSVRAPRAEQCPIQLECQLVDVHPVGAGNVSALQVEVLRSHVDADLVIPGTQYVDPVKWDPLIMKFCEFFGEGRNIHPSRLARGWQMPHRDLVAS